MGQRALTVRLDDQLLLDAKRLALDTGITMTEVVTRLLSLYVKSGIPDKPIAVKRREEVPDG